MQTRTRATVTPSDAPTDDAHLVALGKAMAAHPAVKVEIDALRKQLATAERQAAALRSVIDDFPGTLGKAAKAADAPAGSIDAQIEAIIARMSPEEKALAMFAAAPRHRLDMRGDAPMPAAGAFHR